FYNAIGGEILYSKELFKKNCINLKFLKSTDIKYKQYRNTFIPNLSIIDVMMFNRIDEIQELLTKYELV
ncbi:MAG: WbqC family protein, partial [Bacteroidales bacterium]|nr:WbqC family protein [Bacteroidales bacterium]